MNWRIKKFMRMWRIRNFMRMWRIRNFTTGIKNLIFFLPVIWNYRWWDYNYSLQIFKRSLEQYPENYRKRGLEVESSLNPKIEKMERVLELLGREIEDDYFSPIEEEMGFKYLDKRPKGEHSEMHDRIMKLEEDTWNEIWDIIKGNGGDGLNKSIQQISVDDEEIDPMDYIGDGTDMRGWWD